MPQELLLSSITGAYALCNAIRLGFYVPQVIAVMRDRCGARAISLVTWVFWSFSHAVTAVYCATIANDLLLAGMMWGNTVGSFAVATIAAVKRRQHAAVVTM